MIDALETEDPDFLRMPLFPWEVKNATQVKKSKVSDFFRMVLCAGGEVCTANPQTDPRSRLRPTYPIQLSAPKNGSHYAGEKGIRTIGLGPSREDLAHTVDEYVELHSFMAQWNATMR